MLDGLVCWLVDGLLHLVYWLLYRDRGGLVHGLLDRDRGGLVCGLLDDRGGSRVKNGCVPSVRCVWSRWETWHNSDRGR